MTATFRFLALATLCLTAFGLGAAEPTVDRVDHLVDLFDPNTQVAIENAFQQPASDIATKVQSATWFASLMFLPFLILPLVLLVVVIFRFRDRGDGRKPATFIHNNKLEVFWTAIPIVVVVIVSIPMTRLIYVTDLPAENQQQKGSLQVVAVGQQFLWNYEYPQYGIETGWFDGRQQPVVFQKDRLATMNFTSRDVNHAWAVPAFGIKKDCFPSPRFNYAWFTPDRTGFYDGQCYELCGEGHGRMIINAVVVEEPEFEDWVVLQRHRFAAMEVASALRATDENDDPEPQTALATAVRDYLEAGSSASRILALRYWAAYSYNLSAGDAEVAGEPPEAIGAIRETADEQRAILRNLIDSTTASLRAAPDASEGASLDDTAASPAASRGEQEG